MSSWLWKWSCLMLNDRRTERNVFGNVKKWCLFLNETRRTTKQWKRSACNRIVAGWHVFQLNSQGLFHVLVLVPVLWKELFSNQDSLGTCSFQICDLQKWQICRKNLCNPEMLNSQWHKSMQKITSEKLEVMWQISVIKLNTFNLQFFKQLGYLGA